MYVLRSTEAHARRRHRKRTEYRVLIFSVYNKQ